MSFLDKFNKDKKKKKNVKNPFAQVGKAMSGKNRKFAGEGESLGGNTRPGKILHMTIREKGPVGVKVSVFRVVSGVLFYQDMISLTSSPYL